jgi:large subunit ribosomal protein L4
MATLSVKTVSGASAGTVEVSDKVFAIEPNKAVLHQVVTAQLAARREGSQSTLTRGEVRGGGIKPWRQKGTGRARQGSIRAAQWRGGGNVFGPRPGRNYHQDVPKKVRRLARRSAFNVRAQDAGVIVVDAFDLESPKTRTIVQLLEAAGAAGNVLLLTDGHKPNVFMSARNLPGVQVRPFGEESTYDVLWSDVVLIEAGALDREMEVADA